MKNFIYITGVALHILIAQYAFYCAYMSNKIMAIRGAEWVLTKPVQNSWLGLYDNYMALAWVVGSIVVMWTAWAAKLNIGSKIIGGFFVFSTWNNYSDYLFHKEAVQHLSEWISLLAFIIFAIATPIIWYKSRRI